MSRPVMYVFAGPNGSGKSSIKPIVQRYTNFPKFYINADDLKRELNLEDREAANMADDLRQQAITNQVSFATETLLSTTKNINLMRQAKQAGYEIYLIYVITSHPLINVGRVSYRVKTGGHNVPAEKIIERYYRVMELLPEAIQIADYVRIYDNSLEKIALIYSQSPSILTRRGGVCRTIEKIFPQGSNSAWDLAKIQQLTMSKKNIGINTLKPAELYYKEKVDEVLSVGTWNGESDDIEIAKDMFALGYSKTDIHASIVVLSPSCKTDFLLGNKYAEQVLKNIINKKLKDNQL